ncbi:MAG: hypothetical protein AB7R89_30685 [Dehalococcoidia bacterium]
MAVVFDRMRDAVFGRKPEEPEPIRVTDSPADLQRGDVIVFWDAGDAVVAATLDCTESASGRQSTWRWLFLSSGPMIEAVGRTNTIYEQTDVIAKGTVAFQRLTGSVHDGGVLQTFEARQRDGTDVTDPVVFRLDDIAYRLVSTGTFSYTRAGPLDEPVWRDLSANEGENVYFRMQSTDGSNVLGVWTTDIALLKGRPLANAEIKGLYGA